MKTNVITPSVTASGGFKHLQSQVSARFDLLAQGPLYSVDADKDLIWQTYLNAFPEESRQEHNCNCCKQFIRTAGAAVVIGGDNRISTIWDIADVSEEYAVAISALHAYVSSLPITGRWIHFEPKVGTARNLDKKRDIFWDHFHATLPANHHAVGERIPTLRGEFATRKQVLQRALTEIPVSAVETVLDLVAQNTLYRGPTYKHMLDGFLAQQKAFARVPVDQRELYCWRMASTVGPDVAGIRNSAIGTLLVDLAEGRELDAAVTAYERTVAPTNYRRPTALVTPRMVENAKATLTELGFVSALERRQLDSRDLSVANALFVYRPVAQQKDVFAELAGDLPVSPQKLAKVEELTIEKFLKDVLPTAKGIRVLLENRLTPNFVALTGASDTDAPSLFNWDNSYGWSYTGGVADSIKQRVKNAGGKVDGWMRISLAWNNYDDLDLHFVAAGTHVYYADKRRRVGDTTVHLDVDMNAGGGQTREPVENIYFDRQLPAGNYVFAIHQFSQREMNDTGYTIEVEQGGQVHTLSSGKSPSPRADHRVEFTVDKEGNVTLAANQLSTSTQGITKWGLKTNTWHDVTAITLSPNHWTKPVGNKHFMFMLKGCTVDEKVRPFYNEFLCGQLTEHRKVCEVLADKIEVVPAASAELSGLGFSESLRNYLYVEVTGSFKRTLKVTF